MRLHVRAWPHVRVAKRCALSLCLSLCPWHLAAPVHHLAAAAAAGGLLGCSRHVHTRGREARPTTTRWLRVINATGGLSRLHKLHLSGCARHGAGGPPVATHARASGLRGAHGACRCAHHDFAARTHTRTRSRTRTRMRSHALVVHATHARRVAAAHRKLLLGRRWVVTSPNGRCTEGAAQISSRTLSRIEVIGKSKFWGRAFGWHNGLSTRHKGQVSGRHAALHHALAPTSA